MKRYSLLVFMIISVLLIPWIFFDVDLGDQAYNSLAGWLMAFYPNPVDKTYPYWFEAAPFWFSFFPDYVWWKIIGIGAPLIALRVFWVIWISAMGSMVFLFFSNYASVMVAGLVAVMAALVTVSGGDHFALTYNLVPPSFAALIVMSWITSTRSLNRNFQLSWGMVAGVLAVFTINSRIPSLPFVFLFFVLAALVNLLFSKRSVKKLNPWIGLLVGILVGCGLCWGILNHLGQTQYFWTGIGNFFSDISTGQNPMHSNALVFRRVVGHLVKICIGGGIFFILERISRFLSKKNVALSYAFLTCAAAAISFYKYGTVLGILIGGSFVVIFEFFRSKENRSYENVLLLGGGVFIAFAFAFGTRLEGLQNYKYGLWILLPTAMIMSKSLSSRKTLAIFTFALFFVTRLGFPTFPYLEKPIFSMTTPFQSEFLKPIKSYPEKIQAIDEVTAKLKELGLKSGDELLCYAGSGPHYPISIFYMITKTIPLFHDPGMTEYPAGRWERHKLLLKERARNRTQPKLVVRQKRLFQNYANLPALVKNQPMDFDSTSFTDRKFKDNWLSGEMDELLTELGYERIWDNRYFEILSSKL